MSRLIVFGLDGATPDLIFPWMDEGLLPNLQKIRARGVFGKLNSVPNQRSAAAWSSFITGTNPGRHGIFEFYERVPNSHDIRFTHATLRHGVSFWRYLSENDKKCIIVNVPMTYPAEKINGCLISGLDAPGKDSEGFAYPAGLLREIEQAVGPYIQEPGVTSLVIDGQYKKALEKVIESVRQRGKTVRYLMNRYDWDTTVAVFRETDPAQHCFWRHMGETGSGFEGAVLSVYQEIDREIGEILESAGNDMRVLVMSDHGFGPRQHGNGCLNQWLHEAGFLNFRKNSGGISISGFLKVIYQALEKVLSRQLKERLFGLVPGLISKVHSKVFFSDIDWEHTIAYSDNIMPVIWINTIDAGPAGKVKNEDYEHVVSGLKSALLEECLEASSGRNVVEWVKHREEIYNGDNLYKAPDVLIRWKEPEKIDGLRYGAGGKPIIPAYPTREFAVISGDHRPYGIFMAAGEGIKRNTEVHDLNIVDVPATAIYLNGVPLPVSMEGSVQGQIFEDKFLSEMPLEVSGQGIGSEDGEFQGFSKEEESALRHRLRGLGYLE